MAVPFLTSPFSLTGLSDRPAVSNQRKFGSQLNGGLIGLKTNQLGLIDLADRYGFEMVTASSAFLEKYPDARIADLLAEMQQKNIRFGLGELPLEFRKSETAFREVLSILPARCAALQRAGVKRASTYIMSSHAELTYMENFRLHTRRLKELALLLGDHGILFGLEYVGPRSIWSANHYPFIHTMRELRELIAAIDLPNVGIHLDTAHWFTAGETIGEITNCTAREIVGCDINDAIPGIEPIRDQPGYRRRLPAATGVIDIRAFLGALQAIGYDGFVQAEPFDDALNALDDEAAVQQTARAMKDTFSLIGG